MSPEPLLEGLRAGDMVRTRAVASVIADAKSESIPPQEFLKAVRESPALTDRDLPAWRVWEYVECVESAWRDARYGGNPLYAAVLSGKAPELPYSPLPDRLPWPVLMPPRFCGNGVPDWSLFAIKRDADTGSKAREFGVCVQKGSWELLIAAPRERTELRWLGGAEHLGSLPPQVAGSYRVIIRRGTAEISKGNMVVFQLAGSVCVQTDVEVPAAALDWGDEPWFMDLEADPGAPLRVAGDGVLSSRSSALRCDPESRHNIPLSVRVNDVPAFVVRPNR